MLLRKFSATLTIRKANTKGKLATREIPVIEDLQSLLTQYQPEAGKVYLFPGRYGNGHITSDSADRVLRKEKLVLMWG